MYYRHNTASHFAAEEMKRKIFHFSSFERKQMKKIVFALCAKKKYFCACSKTKQFLRCRKSFISILNRLNLANFVEVFCQF